MNFSEWLEQLKVTEADLTDIISRLEPFITENGFNYEKFEERLVAGIDRYDSVDWVYANISYAESKENNS